MSNPHSSDSSSSDMKPKLLMNHWPPQTAIFSGIHWPSDSNKLQAKLHSEWLKYGTRSSTPYSIIETSKETRDDFKNILVHLKRVQKLYLRNCAETKRLRNELARTKRELQTVSNEMTSERVTSFVLAVRHSRQMELIRGAMSPREDMSEALVRREYKTLMDISRLVLEMETYPVE